MDLEDFGNAIREHGLALPEAWEDHPWGESALKVRKKVFVFNGFPEPDRYTLSVKLPRSAADVLTWENAKPTGYGLGRHGWVSIGWDRGAALDLEAVLALVDESYRAVAPKTLVKRLDAGG